MQDQLVLERWSGRLCNNITQLCHAIFLAEKTRSRLKVLPQHSLLETQDFNFTSIKQSRKTISGSFFDLCEEGIGTNYPDWQTRRQILKEYVRPMLPEKLFPKERQDGLVIYIRSGDIFEQAANTKKKFEDDENVSSLRRLLRKLKRKHQINPTFVQPPLSYYKRIIESKKWSGIQIVAEDKKNPVISELLKTYDIKYQPGELEDDISTLLSAQHLVIGYGTFGITWALLSDHLQSLYSPLVPELVYGELRPGDLNEVEIHPFKFKRYIPQGQWQATEQQKQLMLIHSSKDVVAIKNSQRTWRRLKRRLTLSLLLIFNRLKKIV